MQIELVRMTLDHLDDVMRIEEECFLTPWSRKSFIDELRKNPRAIYLVAMVDGRVAGYGGMWHVINEGHITNVAVAENKRRCGVGDAIVKEIERIARELDIIGLTLEVRMNNASAQRLYFRNGFKAEGIRKNYYSDTREDAIVMWKMFTTNE